MGKNREPEGNGRIIMELDRAKEIIKALADGVDPYTGERFPADGPYQRAATVHMPFCSTP